MRNIPLLLPAVLFAFAGSELLAVPAPVAFPTGTTAKASYGTEADGGPEKLIDGDPATLMRGQANTCKDALEPAWVDLTFPTPVASLVGVETGTSDPFKNYYPKKAQFWIDTDGNGTFDTLAAEATLGPAGESAKRILFAGRIPQAHALRLLVTEQNRAGLNRGFFLSELKLLADPAAAALAVTPDGNVDAAVKAAAAAREVAAKAAAEERRRNAPKADQSIVPGAAKLPGTIFPLPADTKLGTTFPTDKTGGPEKLFDGDPGTWLMSGGGALGGPHTVSSVTLRFAAPVANLGGVETGESDAFHNYYPKELEFWADSNGDGRFDTLLGRTRNVGPAAQCVGRHRFDGRLASAWGLEIRATEQNFQGAKRAFTLNELRLVQDDSVPLTPPTPNSHRALSYTEPLPRGTTARVTVACEDGKGVEMLLDNDPTTFMNPRQGTARADVPVSVFLRWPTPVLDLAGIRIGRSDPHRNYVWEKLQIWADTDGDGTSDLLAGSYTGGGEGLKRFRNTVPTVHGVELRVTKQTLRGTHRAFMLNEVDALAFIDDPGAREMRFVVEDFEDLSSWRVWADNTAQPEGERSYGGYTFVCGVRNPTAPGGQAVGQLRTCFKEPSANGRNSLRAKRGTVTAHEAIIDGIRFDANPQGYPCRITFELMDVGGKKLHTPAVELSGDQWASHAIDLSAAAWPAGTALRYPLRIEHLFLSSDTGGTNDVLLDNIALVGTVSRDRRVTIKPVWEGLAYDPSRPLVVKYRLRNALDAPVTEPLVARLYSSFDPMRARVLVERTVPVTIPTWGEALVAVDFGKMPYGHYEVDLSLDARGIAARHTDFVGVLTLNGQRVNRSPMWIGSMHPGSWISDSENQFVINEVVVPLGLDCYRTGAPWGRDAKRLIDAGLLLAAGAGGGLPKHLQKPGVPRPDVNEPSDYEGYAAYWREKAAKEYAPFKDHVISVEYFNEPDLPGFEYLPEIDVYLKMWRTWAGAMRAGAPGIRLGTGSCTVQHGNAKKDFNNRMYTELAKEADVAVWHAHGPLNNYVSRHRMVENWLRQGGRPEPQWLLGNSEAGAVSRSSAPERLVQADTLVKKIGWAKAQANSLFYIWFTTTDTYDPQGGYLGGDNWGLISYNQRLKPSGQAMNEIVRQLANTEGRGEVALDPRLQTCAYVTEDGGSLWLFWPHESGARFLQNLAVSGPVEVSDMFGLRQTLTPVAGRVSFQVNGYPMYLRAAKGVTVTAASTPEWVTLPAVVGVRPGTRAEAELGLRNVWNRDVTVGMVLLDDNKQKVAEARTPLAVGAAARQRLDFALPAGLEAGTRGYTLHLAVEGADATDTLPLMIAVGEPVVRSQTPLVTGGRPVRPAVAGTIVLDGIEDVHDLVDDPQTPKWAGPEDLSAKAQFAHDGKGLYLRFEVRDQTHNPGEPGEKLWARDSVQVGIAADGKQTEIGFTEAAGGSGWCWVSPEGARVGALKSPVTARREGTVTTYEGYVPFADIGLAYRSGMLIRLTFAVNEDDGKGRVRMLKWFDGIHPGKDLEKFGYLVLE